MKMLRKFRAYVVKDCMEIVFSDRINTLKMVPANFFVRREMERIIRTIEYPESEAKKKGYVFRRDMPYAKNLYFTYRGELIGYKKYDCVGNAPDMEIDITEYRWEKYFWVGIGVAFSSLFIFVQNDFRA